MYLIFVGVFTFNLFRRLKLCWDLPDVIGATGHRTDLEDLDFVSKFINKPIEQVEGFREFSMLTIGALFKIMMRLLLAFFAYIRTFPTKIFELISLPFSYLGIVYWLIIIVQANSGPLAKPILLGSMPPQEELDLHLAAYKYAQSLESYRIIQSSHIT